MTAPAGAGSRHVGIDVGGTKALGVAISSTGELLAEDRRSTPRGRDSIEPLIDLLVDQCRSLGVVDGSGDVSVGIGVPGLVTIDGVLRSAPNLDGVADVPVARLVSERLGFDVVVDNDGTCAAVAELSLGVARGRSEVALVTLGTGLGGAVVSDGRVRRGHNGFAGEFGHMVVDPGGPPCPCGRSGCWERYASGAGLARLARDEAAAGHLESVRRAVGGDPADVRGEDVQRAASAGDQDALAVVDDFARWVAVGLANLTNALDPELFILGGGLASGAEIYLRPIRLWLGELLYQPHLRSIPEIECVALGERAGAIGAALLPTQPEARPTADGAPVQPGSVRRSAGHSDAE
ncbi:MAG: ROK family protein [Acidimicrobiia bacterium]|nr:ROK family protein [Acidimicrobiia bacterium]